MYNVLIVDDHPLIAQSFTLALNKIESVSSIYEFTIKETYSLDEAHELIFETPENKFNLFFIDIKLPPSLNKNLLSGEDLAIEIKKNYPTSKIIIATTYNDNYRLYNLLNNINPDGLFIKNDLKPEILIGLIDEVLNDNPAYSKTVKILLRKLVSNDVSIDRIDRQILYYLSIGERMRNLPNLIPLSLAGIEKRKGNLKEVLNVEGRDDRLLIEIAKEKGYI